MVRKSISNKDNLTRLCFFLLTKIFWVLRLASLPFLSFAHLWLVLPITQGSVCFCWFFFCKKLIDVKRMEHSALVSFVQAKWQ